ncbi:MAG: hypothetical protein Kow0090_11380 [Myxococcota bacterium]
MSVTILNIDKKLYKVKECVKERPGEFAKLKDKLDISWIYHDNMLEGIVLQHEEIITALEDPSPLADASQLALYQGIRNHQKAINIIWKEAENERLRITLDFIKNLHSLLYAARPDVVGGRYRNDIPLHRAYFHDIYPPQRISYYMGKLVQSFSQRKIKALHPIHAAAKLHYQFMYIYPFSEGSGKIARLLMNLILMHNGYMPVIIHAVDRQKYYTALKGSEDDLVKLLLMALDNSLDNALKFMENIPPSKANASR